MTAAAAGDQMATQIVATFDTHVQVHQEQIIASMQAPPQLPGQPEGPVGSVHPGPNNQPGTGMPSNPAAVAAGQEPSSNEAAIHAAAGIGAPNQQGSVPGISADMQAHRTGQ